jgi:hypothetical protein
MLGGCYVTDRGRCDTHSLEFHEAGRHSDVGETTPRMFWFWVLGLGPSEVSSQPCSATHQWPPWLPGKGFPIGLLALFSNYTHWTILYPYHWHLLANTRASLGMKRNENDQLFTNYNNPGPSGCTVLPFTWVSAGLTSRNRFKIDHSGGSTLHCMQRGARDSEMPRPRSINGNDKKKVKIITRGPSTGTRARSNNTRTVMCGAVLVISSRA